MKPGGSSYRSNVVDLYLNERNYSDSDFYEKSDNKLQQSLPKMAAEKDMELTLNTVSHVGYSSSSFDFSDANKQYLGIVNFIDKAPESYKSELSQLLYPIFVHMYLELVIDGKSNDADKFWDLHSSIFLNAAVYKDLVQALKSIKTAQEIASHEYFNFFRSDKYVLKISEDCMDHFIKYLEQLEHTIILQFLNLYFFVDENDESTRTCLYDESSEDSSTSSVKPEVIHVEEVNISPSSDSMTELENCIKKVAEMSPGLPAIYLYSLTKVKNIISADLSSNNEMLACGLENSSIPVWHFTPSWSMKDCFVNDGESSNENSCPVALLKGHGAAVYDVAFTPMTDLLLSCSGDKTVRAWKMDTFETAAIYIGHQWEIWDLDISPMGWYFATASKDHKACLWTMERTYPLNSFIGHNSEVNCVKFHPNGNYLLTGSCDETVRLWSTQEGRMVRMYPGHGGGVYAVAFSPNGKYIASAGEDRKIKIWDIGSSNVIKDLNCHSATIHSLSFNNDGSVLAAAGLENTIRLYDVTTRSLNSEMSLDQPVDGASSVRKSLESGEMPSFCVKSSVEFIRFGLKNLLLAVGVSRA